MVRILERISRFLCLVVLCQIPAKMAAFRTTSPSTRFRPTIHGMKSRSCRTPFPGRAMKRATSGSIQLYMSDSSSEPSDDEEEQGQGVVSSSFNLMKAILGSGVLTLPYGVAAMSNSRQTAIPASLFILALGGLSAYTFYLAGRLCHLSGAKTIGELWDQEIGNKTSWLVSSSIVTFALGASLSYSIMLGDTFSSLAKSVGVKGFLASRHASILAITLTALYPLCTLGSLASLAPASVVGVVGVVMTCLFMAARCFLPSSPYALPNGNYLATLPEQFVPLFGTNSNMASPSALILVAMACCAFQAHYSAPDFYHALRKDDKVLQKFRNLTILGFSGVALINMALMTFGFLTFGANSSGIILNNYSTADLGASICRLLMGISVIGGFPFVIQAAKSAFFKLMTDIKWMSSDETKKVPKGKNRLVTQSFVAIVTGLALVLEDAGFVVSFNGALVGSAIVYIFPCMLFLKATKRRLEKGTIQLTRKLRLERVVSRFLLGFGVVSGILAGTVTVANRYFPSVLRQVT